MTVHRPPSVAVLPCWKRGDRRTKILTRILPGFTWRWNWKSAYDIEQMSFWRRLWPILKREKFDILHVQDPLLADLCRRYRETGRLETREILAHGTEEPLSFLKRFPYVQHLAPWHLSQTTDHRPQTIDRRPHKLGRNWVAIPNFVDTAVFCPTGGEGKASKAEGVAAGQRNAIRQRMGIPFDAFVVGCVAAVKKHHKRMDYLIREMGKLVKSYESSVIGNTNNREQITHSRAFGGPFLLIAGARTDETDELAALAEARIPGRYRIMTDCSRDQMPDVYRTMDVFVLPSLFEMMPIALLEAMASGVPCLVNRHPVLEWMVGAGEEAGSGKREADVRKREGAKGRPEGGDLRPETGDLKVENENRRPETGNLRPETGNLRPETGNLRPEGGNLRPEGGSLKPESGVGGEGGRRAVDSGRWTVEGEHVVRASGGMTIDMGKEGELAQALAGLTPQWMAEHGHQARERALRLFSKKVVVQRVVAYYQEVMGDRGVKNVRSEA